MPYCQLKNPISPWLQSPCPKKEAGYAKVLHNIWYKCKHKGLDEAKQHEEHLKHFGFRQISHPFCSLLSLLLSLSTLKPLNSYVFINLHSIIQNTLKSLFDVQEMSQK